MKKLIAIAGIVISIVALYLALQNIDFAAVWAAIGRIQLALLLLAFVPWLLSIWGKVARWRLLYYPDQERIGQGRLLSAMLIGYLFNTVLPFRTGEVVRATVLRATEGLPVARTLSTILVEKVLDTITLVAGLALILPFINLPEMFRGPAIGAGLVFSGLFVAVLAAAIWPQWARALRGRIVPLLPERLRKPITDLSEQVLEGLVPLRRREVAPRIAAWTITTWVANIAATWVLLFGFGLVLPPTAPSLVVIATNLMMAVPSAPGYVGIYHLFAKEALVVFGVDPDPALAFATVLHAFGFIPVAVAGLVSMIREGLSFAAVQATSNEGAAVATPDRLGGGLTPRQ